MGLLDIFRKDKRVKTTENNIQENKIIREEPVKTESINTHKLDLTKKMDNSFKKLNLDKPDVLSGTLFLLDVSGSMGEKSGDKRKIDHLRLVINNYPMGRKICFSSNVDKGDKIPEPNGSTNLARALRHISGMPNKPKRIVLVSDGEPDSESDALTEANHMELPIDIVFIGNKESKGQLFMEKLAARTGGNNFIV